MRFPLFSAIPTDRTAALERLAALFRIFGWAGFWVQSFLAAVPVALLLFVLFFRSRTGSVTPLLSLISAYTCLAFLIVTIYWCFRYVQIGRRLSHPQDRPSRAHTMRVLWWGLTANVTGAAVATLVTMMQSGQILFKLLALPRGTSMLTRPTSGAVMIDPGNLVSPLQMLAVQAMVNAIAAEVVGIAIAVLLLYRLEQWSNAKS